MIEMIFRNGVRLMKSREDPEINAAQLPILRGRSNLYGLVFPKTRKSLRMIQETKIHYAKVREAKE